MRVQKESLGKVSITANGTWNVNSEYDRLCLVNDGHFATYLSRRRVPVGIELTNRKYWQPVANLREDIKVDYEKFKDTVLNNVTDFIDWDDINEAIYRRLTESIEQGALTVGIKQVDTVEDLDDETLKIPGNFVYVSSTNEYYTYNEDGHWYQMPIIYIGNDEPGDVVWIDPQDNVDIPATADEELQLVRDALTELQEQVQDLQRLQTVGIIPGNTANGYRRIMMAIAEPEKPEDSPSTDTPEEDDSEDKPNVEPASSTVPCICCKMDTAVNFTKNKADLIDGELIFYTDKLKFGVYYGGKFYLNGTGSSSGGGGGDGISIDDLYSLTLDHLNFTNGDNNYKVLIDSDGKWKIKEYKDDQITVGSINSTWKTYISQYFCMNSIYCGGNEENENCLCTHNYIELANGSKQDINLNGVHLLYTDGSKEDSSDIGFIWKVLDLEGVIKAGSTYVIRGARCNTDKNAFIQVNDYDIEWYDGKDLIKFNQGPASFYLCAGDSYKELLETKTLSTPWDSQATKVGYIDACGFGTGSVGEGSATFVIDEDWNKLLFVRWFMLEPAKQGNKAYASRKTTDLWTYINLEKQTTNLGNSIQYYYPDDIKYKYRPMASFLGKTFFTNKTTFDVNHPNYVNITFGIQATDSGTGATRCFNWISVGYYDEFIEYRKKGNTDWIKVYSITDNNDSNPDDIKKFIEHYRRFRWTASDGTIVTTHKCIIKLLLAGEYEYRVGRDNNNLYYSETLSFKVESSDSVSNFSFIHVSDQQGFNWAEYTAWWKTAYMIDKTENDYRFLVNTGDITQSGNRVNEWLDYYQGKRYIIDKCEMFTIGNNDLCGHVSTELTDGEDATSKYSHINVLRYFCFELDSRNDYSFEWDGGTYPIYSLYSFNYGNYHFVSLNSEIAIATSKMYKDWESDTWKGDEKFAQNANAKIEDWFKKDLQLWKGNTDEPVDCGKCIVYMHEMPFTIVTSNFMKGAGARVGSHLNILNANGLYRYSRLFKKYGIRLVLGGHKHTYCVTKPVYDAPTNYIGSDNSPVEGVDLMANVTTDDTRKPVIQVLRAQDVQTNNYARYEVVDKIDAPTYVMSQASGYKLVSNKEQPAGPSFVIPWLLSYFKAKTDDSSPTENVNQHFPMYIRYDVTDSNIKITIKQVHGVWDVNTEKNSKSFNMNKQINNLSVESMTLKPTTDEDKEAYGITDINSYTITL